MGFENLFIVKLPSGEEMKDLEIEAIQRLVLEKKIPKEAMIRSRMFKEWQRAPQVNFLKGYFPKDDEQKLSSGYRRIPEASLGARLKAFFSDLGLIVFLDLLLLAVFWALRHWELLLKDGQSAAEFYLLGGMLVGLGYMAIPRCLKGRGRGGRKHRVAILRKNSSFPCLFQAIVHVLLNVMFWWMNVLAMPFTGAKCLLTDRICQVKAYRL